MKAFLIKTIVFMLLTANISCNSGKKSSKIIDCQTVGTVKDFTGLDGCKMMIVLDNGTKLLPSKIHDTDFKLTDGQRIAFDYEKDKEASMTICMAEDMIVEITCIKSLGGKASKKPICADTVTPMKIDWMKKLVEAAHPTRILKYEYKKKFIYLFQNQSHSYAYDCTGKLMCEMPSNEKNDCWDKIQTFGKARIVYLGESSHD